MLGFFFRESMGEWAVVLDSIEAGFVYLASAGLLIAGLSLENDIDRQRALSAGQGFAILYLGLTVPIGLVYRPLAAAVAAEQHVSRGSSRAGGIQSRA